MIKVVNSVCDNLKKNILHNFSSNLYLYIDVMTYGFSNESISTYIVQDNNNKVSAVIYVYYCSIQLMAFSQISDNELSEVAVFLLQRKYHRVSGPTVLLERLQQFLSDSYLITNGYLMRYSNKISFTAKLSDFEMFYASLDDFPEISHMICRDVHMKDSYTESILSNQLINRYKDGCVNLCIRCDGRIVSHFATYAFSDDLAVLSGMITDPQYRGRGYGSVLVNELSSHVLESGRQPFLYCYDLNYISWYEKLGYSIVASSSKLELKIN